MCTAISYSDGDSYFGRNLDLEYSYGESVTVTPRLYPFDFGEGLCIKEHSAMIGVAYVSKGYPLYFEGINENGLAMAALNFPGNAIYYQPKQGKNNIPTYKLIPWVLCQCQNVSQARCLLRDTNITGEAFDDKLPASPLHWILSDEKESIVLETLKMGMKIYDNPIGVLTNNPSFEYHMINLNNYMNLTPKEPINSFSGNIQLQNYSRGMGAIGLPGDWSSASRFVKAAFVKNNSLGGTDEKEKVAQFFHILDSVAFPRGSVCLGEEEYEITVYSCCCNLKKGTYYWKTYNDYTIKKAKLSDSNLDSEELVLYDF